MKQTLLLLAVFIILFWAMISESLRAKGLLPGNPAPAPAPVTSYFGVVGAVTDQFNNPNLSTMDAGVTGGDYLAPGTQLYISNPDTISSAIASSGANSQALFYGGQISTGG